MSRKSRMQSAREAKDRRAKMMAIGGIVVLAGVLAFEMPKVLHKSSGTSAAPPAETTTVAGTGASATPATTAPGTAAAVLPTASTKLPNSDVAPRRLKSELFSFSHFPGKDPFVPQVSASDITGTPSTGSGSGAAPSAGSGASSGAASGSGSGGSTYTPASQRTLAKTGAVTLQVNGTVQTVRVGGSFPSSNPLFRLVSVAHGVVRIGIANGSYSSGAPTVSLTSSRSLTLVDTADGVRYTIKLVSA